MLTFHLMSPALAALLQVILIDIVLAGDNAVVIGMSAARVPKPERRRVVFWGLVAAVIFRIIVAYAIARFFLHSVFLLIAGGILLLWVAWRLYRDIHQPNEEIVGATTIANLHGGPGATPPAGNSAGLRRAVVQIAIADLSMSLDNVLAVAGAAMNHAWVLTIGLVLSIALMGFAAAMIANLLQRHPWISYAGLIIVIYVALRMLWFGVVAIA